MLAHAELHVALTNLEKAIGLVVPAEALGQIRAYMVAVQHSGGLLGERHHHRERGLADSLLRDDGRILSRRLMEENQLVETGVGRSNDCGASKRHRLSDRLAVRDGRPLVLKSGGVFSDSEGKLDFLSWQ